MLSYDEEIKDQGKKEGIDQSISVIKMLMKQRPIEEIAKKLNLSVDEVAKIRDKFYQ
ncbi:helix-turn-helix domain-containing protein [Neobacillus sp. SM06]|uniref:helix-turn-helix domain-containing protein n=1 Tax=Neobacillus sp. SM06 TaxID=3422492 RepID=UPI003D29FF7B